MDTEKPSGILNVSPSESDPVPDAPSLQLANQAAVDRVKSAYRVWCLAWARAGLPQAPKQDDTPDEKLQFLARAKMGDAMAALDGSKVGLEERALRMLDAVTGDSAQTAQHLAELLMADADQNTPFSDDARVRSAWGKLLEIQAVVGKVTEAGRFISDLAAGKRAPIKDERGIPIRDGSAERLFALLCMDSNIPADTAKVAYEACQTVVSLGP